jgi:hypothetical protein
MMLVLEQIGKESGADAMFFLDGGDRGRRSRRRRERATARAEMRNKRREQSQNRPQIVARERSRGHAYGARVEGGRGKKGVGPKKV